MCVPHDRKQTARVLSVLLDACEADAADAVECLRATFRMIETKSNAPTWTRVHRAVAHLLDTRSAETCAMMTKNLTLMKVDDAERVIKEALPRILVHARACDYALRLLCQCVHARLVDEIAVPVLNEALDLLISDDVVFNVIASLVYLGHFTARMVVRLVRACDYNNQAVAFPFLLVLCRAARPLQALVLGEYGAFVALTHWAYQRGQVDEVQHAVEMRARAAAGMHTDAFARELCAARALLGFVEEVD
jgi:hypothetical protein